MFAMKQPLLLLLLFSDVDGEEHRRYRVSVEFPLSPVTMPASDQPTSEGLNASPTQSPVVDTLPTDSPVAAISPTTLTLTQSPISLTILEQCEAEMENFSTETKYWAICGVFGECDDEENGLHGHDEEHEVRCCADTAAHGFTKKKGCGIYARSKLLGECYNNKNWEIADCVCKKYGGRLCTKEELENDCAEGTGCGHDKDIVWSSSTDEEPATTSAIKSPSYLTILEQCEAEMENFSTETKYWAICPFGDCDDEENGLHGHDEKHEVRCCADTAAYGFTQKKRYTKANGLTKKGKKCFGIWAQSKLLGECYNNKNWEIADCVCKKYGGRLCTKHELEHDCAKGTGCGHDKDIVWSSTTDEFANDD